MRDSYLPRCPVDPLTKKAQFSVRFKEDVAAKLTRAAALRGMRRAEWIRFLLLKRASKKTPSPLTYDVAGGAGQIILIRLTEEDLKRLEKGFKSDRKIATLTFSDWVRAVCMEAL